MKIIEIINGLDLKVISGSSDLSKDISGCYVSDLLSDVMGSAKEGELWITLQTHQNIIAVASLKDLAGIIIVKGQIPDTETINKSNSENIMLLLTNLDTFTIAGRLYELMKTK
jgi:predicted transcriptional regulator